MNIKKIKLIYFSPTGTTKKVLENITNGLKCNYVEHLNLTLPSSKTSTFEPLKQDELAIIGMPVYSGRISSIAIERFKKLKTEKTPAVIVVVYGNRDYEDALLELNDLVKNIGFVPIAGATFIGEHSFSDKKTPIAVGRPDIKDLAKAKTFGENINKKLQMINPDEEEIILKVPGNFPYKPIANVSAAPVTKEEFCTHCKLCITVCPTSAITFNEKIITNEKVCIKCSACIKSCPSEARIMENPQLNQIAEKLSKNCSKRKEPEFY